MMRERQKLLQYQYGLADDTSAILPFPCRRTNSGDWINADLGIPIHIQPAKWRPWSKRDTA
jgi:hypothetical protein